METLSLAVVGLMIGAVGLWRMPVGECKECEHCQAKRQEAERKREEDYHRNLHAFYDAGQCPICRKS